MHRQLEQLKASANSDNVAKAEEETKKAAEQCDIAIKQRNDTVKVYIDQREQLTDAEALLSVHSVKESGWTGQEKKLQQALQTEVANADEVRSELKTLRAAADAVVHAGRPLAADSMGQLGQAMKEVIRMLSDAL